MLPECNLTPGKLSGQWWKVEKYVKELEFQVCAAALSAWICSVGVSKIEV